MKLDSSIHSDEVNEFLEQAVRSVAFGRDCAVLEPVVQEAEHCGISGMGEIALDSGGERGFFGAKPQDIFRHTVNSRKK